MVVEYVLRALRRMLKGLAYQSDLAIDKQRLQVAAIRDDRLQVSISPGNHTVKLSAGILN